MSDRVQRVLDALIEYDDCVGNRYPITSISGFFDDENITSIDKDYQSLTVDEEKQIIQAFLEFSY